MEQKLSRRQQVVWIAALLGIFAIAIGALVAAPPAVSATNVVAGQICGKSDHYKIAKASNGDTVQCLPEGRLWKWKKITAPSGSASVSKSTSASASSGSSASSSAKPSGSVSASTSGSATTSPAASRTSAPPALASSDQLPLTGFSVPLAIVAGLLIVAVGSGAVWFGRRRRTEFR